MAALPSTARIDRAHELRERILACAHARVAEGGFASLTMQALAEDAGIATGSLYRHFSGKGELVAEVFSNACRLEVEALDVLRRAGMGDPRVLLTLLRQERRWHNALASAYATWADVAPDRDALVDE